MTDSSIRRIRDAGTFLGTLEEGELMAELSRQLERVNHHLTSHIIDHGGPVKGKMTLTLDFKCDRAGEFEVVPKLDVKLPAAPRHRSMLWGLDGGAWSAVHPKQMEMFDGRGVRAIPTNPQPAATAAGDE